MEEYEIKCNLTWVSSKKLEGGFAITAIEYSNVTTGQEFNHQGVSFLSLPFEARYADTFLLTILPQSL